MLKYESYQNGLPLKLVIFLHGYNGTIADHQYAIDLLREKLKDAIIIVPQAPQISDKNPQKNQWFGMLKYDSDGKRTKPETSIADIFAIYNSAADDVQNCAAFINDFIDEMQKKFSCNNNQTYLIGFSQGAMLTVYTALSRLKPLAGAFSLSGLVAGADLLAENIKSQPPLDLFHGQDDMKVQYKTLAESVNWLEKHDIHPVVKSYPDLAHKICEAEIEEIAQVINR